MAQLEKPIALITPIDIQEWQYRLTRDGKVSFTLFNQMVCALRFYFQYVRACDWSISRIPFQRRRKRLPTVLSKEEVARLLRAAERNTKHYTIQALLGHSNIRSTEVYLHIAARHLRTICNPLDSLF